MSTSFFKEARKMRNSSNFVAWMIRWEIIVDDNDIWEYIQGKVP